MWDEFVSYDYIDSEIAIANNFCYHVNGSTPDDYYKKYIEDLKNNKDFDIRTGTYKAYILFEIKI